MASVSEVSNPAGPALTGTPPITSSAAGKKRKIVERFIAGPVCHAAAARCS
jgi:hypothetical protein